VFRIALLVWNPLGPCLQLISDRTIRDREVISMNNQLRRSTIVSSGALLLLAAFLCLPRTEPVLAGSVTLNPTSLNFGSNKPNGPPVYRSTTLTNGTGSSITITNMQVTQNTGFSLSSTTCGSTLGAGANCSITVEFNPPFGGYGTNVGSLDVHDSASNSPQTAGLIAIIPCPPTGCP
jgi:hypothetical protein